MGTKRHTTWPQLGALVCFVILLALAPAVSALDARSGLFQITPPPPPPPTGQPTATTAPPPPPPPGQPTATTAPPPPPPPGQPTATATPGAPPPAPAVEKPVSYKGVLAPPSGPAPAKFKINSCAKVVRPPNLSLNEEPGFGAAHIQIVGLGQQVRVLEGPIGADTLWWWKFRSPEGKVGWGVGDYAEPSDGPCVAPTGKGILDLGRLPLSGLASDWIIPGLALAMLLMGVALVRRQLRSVSVKKD